MPREGFIPLSDRQDTVGPTRTVKDAAPLLSIISGSSRYDNVTSSIPFGNVHNYVKACQGKDLSGLRLGVPRSSIPEQPPQVGAVLEKALEELRHAGASIIDNVVFRSERE